MDVRNLRVQHPAASVIDLTRTSGSSAIDEALRRRATSVAALSWALKLMPGRAHNTQIAQFIRDSRDEPWSALERLAHKKLHAAGLTGWRANYPIQVPWGWIYADLAFPVDKVIVELDGWEFHQSRASFVNDRRRDVALHLAGWTVLRFTADSLEEVVPHVRQHLTTRRRGRN